MNQVSLVPSGSGSEAGSGSAAGRDPRGPASVRPEAGRAKLSAQAVVPDFALRNQHGETVELSGLAGDPVVLMFYPFAFSRVCSAELNEVYRRWNEFQHVGARLLAISCDAVHTLRAYAEQLTASVSGSQCAGLHLLSDFWPHGALAQRYGVFNEVTGAAQRVSFLLDEHLQLRHTVASENGEARSLNHTLELLRGL